MSDTSIQIQLIVGDLYDHPLILEKASNGSWYLVTVEATTSPYNLRIYKFPHDMASYTLMDDANGPAMMDRVSFLGHACYDLANKTIHIVYLGDETAGDIRYTKFYTSEHPTKPDLWETSPGYVVVSAATGYVTSPAKICVDPNGKVHMLFIKPTSAMGTPYNGVYYTNNISGTFKTPILIGGGSGVSQSWTPHGIACDTNSVPHIAVQNITGAVYSWGYGNQSDATSFTLGAFPPNKYGGLHIDPSTNNMLMLCYTNGSALQVYVESTFPSATTSQTTATPVPSSSPRGVFIGGVFYVFFCGNTAPYVDHLMARKWTVAGGWGAARECLIETEVVPDYNYSMHWDERSGVSVPDAIGCTAGYYYGTTVATYWPLITLITPAVAAAGCEASGHLYAPPLVVTPGNAHAHCAASATVASSGPQVVENPICSSKTAASCTVFQSSVTQTPGRAEAGVYAFAILQSDNHELRPDLGEAQCWASIGAITIGQGNVFCIPSPARARITCGPDFTPIYDERPFNSGHLEFPALEMASPGTWLNGEAGYSYLDSQSLSAWGFMVVEGREYGAAVLPALSGNGSGLSGRVGAGSADLPTLTLLANNTERAGRGDLSLWLPTLLGYGIGGTAGNGSPEFEPLQAIGFGPGLGLELSGAAQFPALGISGAIARGFLMSGAVAFTPLWIFIADAPTLEMFGAAVFPALQAQGTIGRNEIGTGAAIFPALYIEGIAEPDLEGNFLGGFLGLVTSTMNMPTGAVTDYDNFHFNSYAFRATRYLGASESGIFELGGESDDGLDIESKVQKVGVDLGSFHHKRVIDAYLHLHSSGPYRVLSLANGIPADYLVSGANSKLHSQKVNLSRGLKGSELGFGYENEEGSDFILDQIDYLIEATSRKNG